MIGHVLNPSDAKNKISIKNESETEARQQQPARAQSVHKSLTVPQISRSRSNSSRRQTSPCKVQRAAVTLGPVMEQTRGPSIALGPPLPGGNLAGTNLATPPRLSCQTPERCYRDASTLPEHTGWDDHQERGSSISSECENQSLAHNGHHQYLEELKSQKMGMGKLNLEKGNQDCWVMPTHPGVGQACPQALLIRPLPKEGTRPRDTTSPRASRGLIPSMWHCHCG